MPFKRRLYNRLEVHIVGEFKPLSKPAVSFLGITRDFSYGGFSFESQSPDLGPGDILAFRFKHPESDLIVSTQGVIVWKRNAERFICLMGIKFRDISDSVKNRMLKIMSAAGDVPVSLFLSGENNESDKINEAGTGQISNKEGNKDASNIRGYKKRIAVLIAIAGAMTLSVLLPAKLDNLINTTTDPGADSAVLIPLRGNEYNQPQSQADAGQRKNLIKEISYRAGSAASAADKAGQAGLPSDNIDKPDEFYVQVGSWKNPDYAIEIREQLIEYYQAAYILVVKDFHVIRIPGIKTKTAGDKIIKDIENKYKLSPFLALKS